MQNHQYSVKLAGVRCRFNPNVFGSVYELALRKLAKPSEAEPKKLPGGRKLGERLKLVLDLDNTLLNAVSTAKLNVGEVDLNDFVVDGSPQMYLFSLPQLPEQRFLLKLRPYVHEFLAEVSKSCELSIHTNATREYADVVLAVLDPDRSYFGGRVVARDQSGSNDQKKDLDRLYESSSSNGDILILDDRTDVWDDTLQSNIIRCAFYGYLEHHKENFSRRYGRRSFLMANQLLSTSAFADHDQQLTYLATMITKVARRYQESALNGEPLHVRALLRDVSSKILAPSRVLLTGFNKSAQKSTFGFHDSGPRFRLKLTALGAEVVDDPEDSSITHIVVMRQTNTTTRAM
ncbi:MAG: uncharacterized protein KVP18_001166 [Porospora cf. gigantea A]|nr:MAG: hypothetical protein KVP18_001166 [Porospora cf. gigantea A]